MLGSVVSASILRPIATVLSQSFLFQKAKVIWSDNQFSIGMSLTKIEKAWVGIYLIMKDYARGEFPPTFEDQRIVYDNEISYLKNLPGLAASEATEIYSRKPFLFSERNYQFLKDVVYICRVFETLDIHPPMRLLELGCGNGWMAEILSTMNFNVLGTTISPDEIQQANRRVLSLRVKGIASSLQFMEAPMETVDQSISSADKGTYDCVYVYEALHHAYSWEDTISSSLACLKPGGWLLICREPNLAHTWVSYRISILAKTHEIGMNRKALIKCMKANGFKTIHVLRNNIGLGIAPIWLAARK